MALLTNFTARPPKSKTVRRHRPRFSPLQPAIPPEQWQPAC
jgi:hypothetical protein